MPWEGKDIALRAESEPMNLLRPYPTEEFASKGCALLGRGSCNTTERDLWIPHQFLEVRPSRSSMKGRDRLDAPLPHELRVPQRCHWVADDIKGEHAHEPWVVCKSLQGVLNELFALDGDAC